MSKPDVSEPDVNEESDSSDHRRGPASGWTFAVVAPAFGVVLFLFVLAIDHCSEPKSESPISEKNVRRELPSAP